MKREKNYNYTFYSCNVIIYLVARNFPISIAKYHPEIVFLFFFSLEIQQNAETVFSRHHVFIGDLSWISIKRRRL